MLTRSARVVLLAGALAVSPPACGGDSTGPRDKQHGSDAGAGYQGPMGAGDGAADGGTDQARGPDADTSGTADLAADRLDHGADDAEPDATEAPPP